MRNWFSRWFKKEEPVITKLEVMELKEGDVVVIEFDTFMNDKVYERIKAQIELYFPGVKWMLIEHGTLKSVLRFDIKK